jgi:hypothetical protein
VEPVGSLTVLAAFSSLWSEAVGQLSLTLRDSYRHLEITGLREIGHGPDARDQAKARYSIERTKSLCRRLTGG